MSQFIYKYTEDQCDVNKKTSLAIYRRKRSEWLEQLNGEDVHQIWGQIHGMLWSDTVFRVVNECLRIAEETPHPDVSLNGDVSELLAQGFVALQTLTIRRLTEKNPKRPDLAVYSLRRVLHEIREHREHITREVYVGVDGLPYDYEAVYRKELETETFATSPRVGSIPNTGPKAWPNSDSAHKAFDELSGVEKSHRSRDDLIQERVFELLESKLNVCENAVCRYVDKFVAHAADPENRTELTEDQQNVSFSKLDSCYQSIVEVARYLSGQVLWHASHGGLPTPQYDHLENFDKKLALTENIDRLRDLWKERDKIIKEWRILTKA